MGRKEKRTISETFHSFGGFCGWKKIRDTEASIVEPEIRRIFNGIFV